MSLNERLHKATVTDDLCEAASLLDQGADIEIQVNDFAGVGPGSARGAPLRFAAEYGRLSMVQLLLDRGANVHAQNDIALRLASIDGHAAVVALLLDRGADIHAENDDAIRWAALRGQTAVVSLLIDRGADPRAANDQALIEAANRGHADTVALLIRRVEYPSATLADFRDSAIDKALSGIVAVIDSYRQLLKLRAVNAATMAGSDTATNAADPNAASSPELDKRLPWRL